MCRGNNAKLCQKNNPKIYQKQRHFIIYHLIKCIRFFVTSRRVLFLGISRVLGQLAPLLAVYVDKQGNGRHNETEAGQGHEAPAVAKRTDQGSNSQGQEGAAEAAGDNDTGHGGGGVKAKRIHNISGQRDKRQEHAGAHEADKQQQVRQGEHELGGPAVAGDSERKQKAAERGQGKLELGAADAGDAPAAVGRKTTAGVCEVAVDGVEEAIADDDTAERSGTKDEENGAGGGRGEAVASLENVGKRDGHDVKVGKEDRAVDGERSQDKRIREQNSGTQDGVADVAEA